MNISVVGIGRLGVSLLTALASKGHQVIGLDIDKDKVNKVNNFLAPYAETDLQKMMKDNKDRIEATSDYKKAVDNSEISFILVNTPSKEDGSLDNSNIFSALEGISSPLKEKEDYHLVVISSTVTPGSMQKFESFLEEKTGKKCGEDFGLCYNPDFVKQGSIIQDYLNPDIVVIGEADDRSGEILEKIWRGATEIKPLISRMNFINAELTKTAFNVFSTVKISFINLFSRLCERNEGANVNKIMDTIKEDERIGGKKVFGVGLGYGGPCLPRDNAVIQEFGEFSPKLDIFRIVENINDSVVPDVINLVEDIAEPESKIGILGLTYKPDTYLVECSQAYEISEKLSEYEKYEILTYDPMAEERNCSSKEEVIEKSDVILILTPWDEFREISREDLLSKKIYDAWQILYDDLSGYEGYYARGVGRE